MSTPYKQASHCCYCHREFSNASRASSKTREHLIPKDLCEAPIRPAVIVAACGQCNWTRSNLTPAELRVRAGHHRRQADLLEAMADRVDELVEEHGLTPPWAAS